jgi:hypothetical protein
MYRIGLHLLLCWVALSLFCSASAGAASPTSSPRAAAAIYLPIVARAPVTINDLAVSAPNLYVATGATLTVIDIAQPAQARSLATLTLPQPISALAAAAPYVYVLTAPPSSVSLPADAATLYVINAQTPNAPTIQGQLAVKAYQGSRLVYADGSLYIAGYVVQQIDVSQPQQPQVIRSLTLLPATRGEVRLAARSGALYVASNHVPSLCCNSRYFERLVSGPAGAFAPQGQWSSTSSFAIRFAGVALLGDTAYVATTGLGSAGGGLIAFDLRNPASLTEGAFTPLTSNPLDIQVAGAYAYVSQSDNSVAILRPGDAGLLSPVGQVALPARPQALRVDNGRAYIADVNGNVLIADVTTPEQPVVLGSFTP